MIGRAHHPPVGPAVPVENSTERTDLDVDRWAELAGRSLVSRGVTRGELQLQFVDESAMTELNREHMDEDRPTDVLSFPLDDPFDLDDPAAAPDPTLSAIPVLLGDIVICPDYAERQAAEHQRTFDDEIALLVVHGVLHILGMDHADPDEASEMQAVERELLTAHYQPNGQSPYQSPDKQ